MSRFDDEEIEREVVDALPLWMNVFFYATMICVGLFMLFVIYVGIRGGIR